MKIQVNFSSHKCKAGSVNVRLHNERIFETDTLHLCLCQVNVPPKMFSVLT